MNLGYVKLYRKLLDSQVFHNEGLLKLWIYCLLRVNHEEAWVAVTTGRGSTEVPLKPGQFLFGRNSAAKELRMSPTTVWARMLKLQKLGNLVIQSDTHFSIITIVNWDSYQCHLNKDDRKHDNQVTGNRQPNDTDKNDKNEKKEHTAGKMLAETLVNFYASEINPPAGDRSRALKNAARKIRKHGFENLRQAVLNYKSSIIRSSGQLPERQYRKKAANFFGINEPFCEDYFLDAFGSDGAAHTSVESTGSALLDAHYANAN